MRKLTIHLLRFWPTAVLCHGRLALARARYVLSWGALALVGGPLPATALAVDFNAEIAPLLIRRCVECHQGSQPTGGLNLTTRRAAMAGGEGGRLIAPGLPDDSRLFQRVAVGEMPPAKRGRTQTLPDREIALLRQWIAEGAHWPDDRELDLYENSTDFRGGRDWWSLRPVRRPQVPQIQGIGESSNPIDAFVMAKLAQAGMRPAPRADRRIRIRRLWVSLLGLPPTYEQIEAFARDESPTAWEDLVDRLLASRQYGQRWARHWLDVVRFAETSGYERDQEKPFAWKYRDWVVDALNDDKPYDRFVLEQLAGDELPDRTVETVVATGFLRLGTWNDEPNDDQDYKFERLEDLVHATSSAFLGLTLKCARCHDHKFDPIPQVDYYRVASAFWPGPLEPRDRALLGGPTVDELGVPDVLAWTDVDPAPPPLHVLRNGDRHRPLGEVQPAPLTAIPDLFRPFADPPSDATTSQRRLQLARWIVHPDNPLTARVMVNRIWQHHFGQGIVRSPNNFGFRGDLPTHPKLLDWLAAELVAEGWQLKRIHRLILLSNTWQQSSQHPEFAECAAADATNRLWWRAERQRLDAESLRDALLSVSGEIDLRAGGPSFRPTIRPDALEGLSRKGADWKPSAPDEQRRRSLYIYVKRHLLPPMMTTFDFCDTTLPCGQRNVTTGAPQALALMNHPFAHARSEALAVRVAAAHDREEAQIVAAWTQVLGRQPGNHEIRMSQAHLATQRQQLGKPTAGETTDHQRVPTETTNFTSQDRDLLALASLCHVLLNSNEFLYVD